MSFQLVPKSVTLNDLERRNGRVVFVNSLNSLAVGTYYVQRNILRVKCSPKHLVLVVYHL